MKAYDEVPSLLGHAFLGSVHLQNYGLIVNKITMIFANYRWKNTTFLLFFEIVLLTLGPVHLQITAEIMA